MSMRIGHIAGVSPPALLGAVYLPAVTVNASLDLAYRAGFFVLALATSSINDWDHSRFRDRWHPGAAFARITARALYRIHTSRDLDRWDENARRYPDRDPDDLHRGPTHAIEWCLAFSFVLWLLADNFPPLAPASFYVFAGVLLGTGSHVAIDALTPSGVPGSMIWNYFVHGEVWRRHAVSLRWYEIGAEREEGPVTFRSPGLVTWELRLGPLVRDVPGVGIVDRTLQYPTPCVLPVDESSEGCRPGLFYTDGCAEKLGFVPLSIFSTLVLGLVVTGTFRPVMWALTGWSMFAPGPVV